MAKGHSKLTAEQWGMIRCDYELGVTSVEDIAAKHGISRRMIFTKARQMGWIRDKGPAMNARAEEKLLSRDLHRVNPAEELKIIELGAEIRAHVMANQRNNISKAAKLCAGMFMELEAQAMDEDTIRHLAELQAIAEGQDTENPLTVDQIEGRVKLFRKLMSLDNRAATLKTLTQALKDLVNLERLAYGIADNANGDANTGGTATEQGEVDLKQAARKVAYFLELGLRANNTKTVEHTPDENT